MAENYKGKTLFCALCTEAGLILKNGSESNEINVDKTAFQRNITYFLKNQTGDVTEVVEEFLEGFGEYIDNKERFHRSLLPTFTTSECESARSKVQESVVRLLLGVELIQPSLVRSLLEKLPEFSQDDGIIFDAGERVDIPHLLLAQLRWLDFIVDNKALREVLLEMLDATSEDVQREIISVLPAVLDDTDHTIVAMKLNEVLVSRSHLTVAVLDTLTCLELTPDLLAQVRQAAVQALKLVDADNLVVVIKFLLRTASQAEMTEVVAEIRRGIDLPSLVDHRAALAKGKCTQIYSSNQRDTEVLIMDAIQSGIQFQRGVADAWLKMIDSLKEKLNILDLVVILLLHQTSRRKSVESLVRNKIRSGDMSEPLLQKAFSDHSQMIQRQFKSLMMLAEMLLRGSEMSFGYIGGVIYKLIFANFDTFCKQETVATLVMQLGSGNLEETDVALDVLASLVEEHLKDMVQFAIFFKRLLDLQQQNMSLQRLRKLFAVLSRIAFCAGNDPALMQDDLHMVIRKLISSVNPKCLCQGLVVWVGDTWVGLGHECFNFWVICFDNLIIPYIRHTLMCVHIIHVFLYFFLYVHAASLLGDEREQEVTSLLNMLRAASSRHSQPSAVFLDELAALVMDGSLHPKVQTWVSEHMTDMFQENFVVDADDKNNSAVGIPMTAQFSLNQEEESNIVINLLPLVAAEITECQKSEQTVYAACLSPHFRLVQICESHQHQGNMEGIDALLGCPIYVPDEYVYEKFESFSDKEKDVICTCLLHCINWFREVINAFASQTDVEMKGKVVQRLYNITHLQKVLIRCMKEHPRYNAQLLGLGVDDQQSNASHSNTKNKAPVTKAKGSRKRKRPKERAIAEADEEVSQDATFQEKETQGEGEPAKSKKLQSEGDKTGLPLYYRELDLSVFHILHSVSVLHSCLDLDLQSKDTHKFQIQAQQLNFLLEDLVKKMNHALIASTTHCHSFFKARLLKKTGFSNLDKHSSEQTARFCVKLLPTLCSHLDAISNFFQTQISRTDDEIDDLGTNTLEAEEMAVCFHLVLQALQVLFAWNGFGLLEHRELLRESVALLAAQVKAMGTTQMSFIDLLSNASLYIENFAETVPTLAASTTLIKLLAALTSRCENTTLRQRLGELAHKQVQREWGIEKGDHEKGASVNEMLQFHVRIWIINTEDPFQTMENIANTIKMELVQGSRQGTASELPCLTRSTFPVFLRVIMSELVEKVKGIPLLKRSDDKEIQEKYLVSWSAAVRVLFLGVGLVKELNSRGGISACMKYGRQFVEIFLQRAMPVLDASFISQSTEVHSLLRTLQQSTRILQNMCGHAKRTQDITQVNQVPVLKRALERLVLRVKHMLTINHCQRAFWVGNLKNKTLQGEEIPSQAYSEQKSSGADSEGDEEPMSEEESELEAQTEEKVGVSTSVASDDSDGSYSEIY
ncbi:Fanconi anemia group D2 protein-like [Pomacea canaliculata]|uniref:Fanconi anemia group D2 protein-like n=1 Tax=Pomacea canaliculata TaxID=400727 RepID=UPI000D725BE6|nr:Fanconi anemia group D2 protein-like [Pomacea canaliculata]